MDQKVYEIQEHLARIARYESEIPAVIPDGLYGSETTAAVEAFQRWQGLPPSGEIDFTTWEAIRDTSNALIEQYEYHAALRPFAHIMFAPGVSGTPVFFLQLLLNDIATLYANCLPVELTGVYDEATVRAVECISELHNGKNPYNRIIRIANSMMEL